MIRNPKKTNTLFHSIREYRHLEQIILDKGFKASYADEVISGYSAKILMVSFSNVALLESETQINYGNYSIGLSLDWGKRYGLQPVMYTYNESEFGATFFENYFVSGKDHAILEVLNESGEKQNFGLILDLKQIRDNSYNMLIHLKPYHVKNKAGDEFVAYNDREWRYVHKSVDFPPVLFERNFLNGAWSLQYKEANNFSKPYTPEPVLLFDLFDLKYLIVEEKSQKKNIFEKLSSSFGNEQVIERLTNGDLDILSRDTMWDNL